MDIRDPLESYSAAEFCTDALQAMAQISAAGRIPLLVGGTMLYFKALLEGLAEMPAADAVLRAELEAWAAAEGYAALHEELRRVDPQSAQRIHPNDPQRLVRALEVYRLSGLTMSEHRLRQQARGSQGLLPYTVAQLAIAPAQRQILHERIALRFELMLEQGLISEVEALRARGDLHLGLPSMRAVGYRQVWEYLDGNIERHSMVERGVAATRQLAKRQFTWLRGWQTPLHWLDSQAEDNVERALKYLQAAAILA